MKEKFQKLLPHIACILLFMGIALAFFYPVLQGKEMQQSDIVQYIGMSKERNDFREVRESYWTNSAFGGMPTYQLGAEYPYNYIKQLDRVIRFLPRPAVALWTFYLSYHYSHCGAQCQGACYRLFRFCTGGNTAGFSAEIPMGIFAYNLSFSLGNQCQPLPNDLLLTAISLGFGGL